MDESEEVVLVVGDESLLTDDLVATLNDVGNGVDLLIDALTSRFKTRYKRPCRTPQRSFLASSSIWPRRY